MYWHFPDIVEFLQTFCTAFDKKSIIFYQENRERERDSAGDLFILDKIHSNQSLAGLHKVWKMSPTLIQMDLVPSSAKWTCSLRYDWKPLRQKFRTQKSMAVCLSWDLKGAQDSQGLYFSTVVHAKEFCHDKAIFHIDLTIFYCVHWQKYWQWCWKSKHGGFF